MPSVVDAYLLNKSMFVLRNFIIQKPEYSIRNSLDYQKRIFWTWCTSSTYFPGFSRKLNEVLNNAKLCFDAMKEFAKRVF